jgi:hypothetical protein
MSDEEANLRQVSSGEKKYCGQSFGVALLGGLAAVTIVGLTGGLVAVGSSSTEPVASDVQRADTCAWRFDPSSDLPSDLRDALEADTVRPGQCDQCHTGETAVWIAPGDLCSLKQAGYLDRHNGEETDFCNQNRYKDSYSALYHFKTCVEHSALDWLWANDRCKAPSPSTDVNGTVTMVLDRPWVQKDGALYCAWWNKIKCGGCKAGMAKIFEEAFNVGVEQIADEVACEAIGEGTGATACEVILGGPEDPAADVCAVWVSWAIGEACGEVWSEIADKFAEKDFDACGDAICDSAGGC